MRSDYLDSTVRVYLSSSISINIADNIFESIVSPKFSTFFTFFMLVTCLEKIMMAIAETKIYLRIQKKDDL